MLKKTSLALMSLAYSGAMLAGTMGPVCAPGNVTIPCEGNNWAFDVQALYLKPVYSRRFAVDPLMNAGFAPTPGLPFLNSPLTNASPDGGWGYRLQGSYFFNTGNDISLSFMHYDVDTHLGSFNGSYIQLLPAALPLVVNTNFGETLNNRFNQVNLTLGQHIILSEQAKAHFYGGMQYANIHVNETRHFNVPSVFRPAIQGAEADIDTDFNGIGPVVGVDYSYALFHGLSIVANSSASLLVGTSRFEEANSYKSGLVVNSLYNSERRLVPSLEAKLGANYSHEFAMGVLSVEGGYEAVNYFSSLQNANFIGSSYLPKADFGLYGPYFGLRWLG